VQLVARAEELQRRFDAISAEREPNTRGGRCL
jgi:hypothetical protein